jgi:hypothetical protein
LRAKFDTEVLALNVDEESGDEWPAFEDWLQDVLWSGCYLRADVSCSQVVPATALTGS